MKIIKPLFGVYYPPLMWGGYLFDNYTGYFDNRIYIRRISEEYTGMAFRISWYDLSNSDGTNTYMSIGRTDHAGDLINHPLAITRNGISLQDYMPEL